MLDRDNLLDIIRTFTLFSTSDKGEIIKIVGRYQQFRAVKLAVKRLLDGKNPRERSGIIWHTQCSGKSLTQAPIVSTRIGIAKRKSTPRMPQDRVWSGRRGVACPPAATTQTLLDHLKEIVSEHRSRHE
jgi:rRNA processing protein Krr1/Pno1